jgi:hypothetical protein
VSLKVTLSALTGRLPRVEALLGRMPAPGAGLADIGDLGSASEAIPTWSARARGAPVGTALPSAPTDRPHHDQHTHPSEPHQEHQIQDN